MDFFARRRGFGAPDSDPIFIVGLPRSGSTLLEQILASHSKVDGTQELPNIQHIVQKLRGREPDPDDPRYPRILEEIDAQTARKLGEHYLEGTRVYRTGRPRFADKMPNNFRHLGLIHLILPNARIIDARREPMACCFSNLKQLFAQGQEFTYSISDIARYYRTYLELMDHWDRVLPGRILRVYHEDVVEDPKAACAACWISAGWSSSANASIFTRPAAAYARRAPSRYAARSTGKVSSSGSISSRGSIL